MLASMLKTAAATAAYAVVHSALATRTAKEASARWIGRRPSDGLYRAFYQAQSFATLGALIAYIRSLPDRELYRARGPMAVALRGGQVAALGWAGWSMVELGLVRFTGLDGVAALATGADQIPPKAEGHGPEPGPSGAIEPAGPFRLTRHPVHLAFPLVTWLNPRMTTNLLAYNLAATAYFFAGAAIEEARLRQRFGEAYRAYEQSGVPFLIPAGPDRPETA